MPLVLGVSKWMLQAIILAVYFAQYVVAQESTTPSGETGVTEPVTHTDGETASSEEGSCPNAESHATPDFGSQVSTLTFFLYITILLSLGITYLRNFLKRKTMNYPHIQEVLEGVYEELSVVGVTSFLLFVAETSTVPQIIAERVEAGDVHEFTSVFHEVHMALFFIVFLFLLTVIVVQLYTKNISSWWYVYETRSLQDNIKDWQFVNQLRLRSNLRNWLFDLFNHSRVVEVNDALAFTLIKARFLTQYAGKGGIPANFSFARYLHLSLNEISVQCVHLHWSIWLFTLTAIGLNWIRYKVIPVSSSAASVILMVTGIFSVFVFLFLFWKGRAIRRRLLDERHFYDPRFFNKLIHVETILPISLYDDYAHHKADFTRLLTFSAVQNQHRSEDQWRKEQERKMKEQSILDNPESQPLAGAVIVHIPSSSSTAPPPATQPEKLSLARQASTAKLPREIFTSARLNEVSVAQPPVGNNVADLSARDRAASFLSAENSKAYNNPLTPQRAPIKAQGSMRRLSSTSNLNHLLSHKAVMAHPMGKKPNAQSIFDPNGEAAGLETKPMVLVQRGNRSRDASKRRASANMSALQASVQNASAQELHDWEKSHEAQIAREKKEADLRSEQTSALLLLDGHHQQAQSAARNEHIYQGEMDASGNIHCASPPRDSVLKPLDISQHPRHIADVREGDELNDEDGTGDDMDEEEEEDDEAHMRLLQMKQMAMQKFIKEMHEEAIRNSKLQCCASIIPPAGSRSQLEEAFILSDPGIHLRLFQIIMLFQSTYLLASVYYFIQLRGQVQVIFLVFTFIPIVLALIIFLPKFLRNHTITTSLHSEIRLNVVSEMMEAEELQKEEHHMNSLHVRLQARALSLSEVPISAFAGEYISDHEPFRPLARNAADQNCKTVETGLMSMKVRLDKDREAAAAAAKLADASPDKGKEKAKPVETLWNVSVRPPSQNTTTSAHNNTGTTPLFSPSLVSDAPTPVYKDAVAPVSHPQPAEPSYPPVRATEVELAAVSSGPAAATAAATSSTEDPPSQTVRIVRKSPADSLSAYAGPTQVVHVRKTSSSSAKSS